MAKQKQEKKQIIQKPAVKKTAHVNLERWYGWMVFAFSILIYFNSVFNSYNLDDELVTQNHRFTSKGVSAIPEIFTSPYYEDKAGYKYEYRPIVLVSFAIEHSLFGDNAQASHFINVLLYGLVCLLLFHVLKALLQQFNPLLPFIITLLFAAHPIHTEVVASIKNRDELLGLGFSLLALWFAWKYHHRNNIMALLVMPLFLLLSILSKSTSITFILLIPFSLIMFTDIKLSRLLLITVLLAIPAVFFSRLYSVAQLIGLLVAVLGAEFALYYLRHSDFNPALFKSLLPGSQEPGVVEQKQTLDFGFFKSKVALFLLIPLVLALTALSLSGISIGKAWLTIAPLAALALIYLVGKQEIKLLLITPISLITIYALTRFDHFTSLIETGLIIFLALHILSSDKSFRITALINYAVYAVVALLIIQSKFFLAILLFAWFFDKRLLLLTASAAVLSLIVMGKHVFDVSTGKKIFSLAYLALPIIFGSLFLLWKHNRRILLQAGPWLIIATMLLYFVVAPPTQNSRVITGLTKGYYTANAIKAPDITPVSAVRPLKFIEYPIDNKTTPMTVKLGTAMLILGHYLRMVFIPYPMSYYYGYAYIEPTSLWSLVPLLVLLTHVLLLFTGLYFIRKNSLLAFGILFYLISISVFSNLLVPIPGLVGDRFLLIPSIGFCFVVAALLMLFFKQSFSDNKLQLAALSGPLKVSLAMLLFFYSVGTVARNSDWKDRVTLFRKDIKAVENSAQAQNLLGLHLFLESNTLTDTRQQRAMREEAVRHLRKAIEIYPDFLNASFDLGRVYETLQMPDSAYAAFQRTTRIEPTFVAPYFGMGIILQNKGRLEEAIPLYEKFLTVYNTQLEPYANLSYAYFMLGRYDSSLAVNRRAIRYLPSPFEPTINMAKTFIAMNQRDSALYYLDQADRIRPNDLMTIGIRQRLGQ